MKEGNSSRNFKGFHLEYLLQNIQQTFLSQIQSAQNIHSFSFVQKYGKVLINCGEIDLPKLWNHENFSADLRKLGIQLNRYASRDSMGKYCIIL